MTLPIILGLSFPHWIISIFQDRLLPDVDFAAIMEFPSSSKSPMAISQTPNLPIQSLEKSHPLFLFKFNSSNYPPFFPFFLFFFYFLLFVPSCPFLYWCIPTITLFAHLQPPNYTFFQCTRPNTFLQAAQTSRWCSRAGTIIRWPESGRAKDSSPS